MLSILFFVGLLVLINAKSKFEGGSMGISGVGTERRSPKSSSNSNLATNKKVKDDEGDYYVLAYIWEAESCYGSNNYPGCADPQEYWEKYFVIHGLWPQYMNGGYPSNCDSEPFSEDAVEAVGMDTMIEMWPNVQDAEGSDDYTDFWDHEWTKHGTCSGLDQTVYFNTTINLVKEFGTPSIVTSNVGKTIDADDIRNAFGGSTKVALQCDSGKYLSGAFTCWSKDSDGYPKDQIECANDVQGEDTCSSSSVTIPEFE